MDVSDKIKCVRLAESKGFESAWMTEGYGGDAFSILTASAMSTDQIKLGTGVVSVFTRSPPTIAMGAGVVDAFSKGRFILGLGSSHKVQVEHEHGLKYESPIERVRETVEIVRGLIRSGSITYEGKIFSIKHLELGFPRFRTHIPIYLAALNPKMLELAGEIADGVIFIWKTVERTRVAIETIVNGTRIAGRNMSQIDISALLPCFLSRDSEKAKDAARRAIAFYGGVWPRYNKMFCESGFASEAKGIRQEWYRGDERMAASAVSDEMVAAFTVVGTPEQAKAQLERYAGAGLQLPIIMPYPVETDCVSGVVEAIRTFGQVLE